MEEPFNPFEHLDLTEHEMEIVDGVEFDLPKLVEEEEAIFALSVLLERFKEEKGMITEDNISSLSYLFNRFLTHISLIRVDECLLEMFFAGEMMPELDENDEWIWSLTDEAREHYEDIEEGEEIDEGDEKEDPLF